MKEPQYMYVGYFFNESGQYRNANVEFTGDPAEIFEFVEQNKNDWYEIRIVAKEDDAIVVQCREGQYIFPEEAKVFNRN